MPLNTEIRLLCGKPEFPQSGIATLRNQAGQGRLAFSVQETRAGAALYRWVL